MASSLTPEEKAQLRAALASVVWRAGRVSEWLLDPGQLAWWDADVWMVGRQRGKSFGFFTRGLDAMVREPSIVRYAALTGKSAAAIAVPTLKQLLADCPFPYDLREDRGTLSICGSTLTWAGTDNEQFDRLRGPRAHLIGLDECAFYSDLERVEQALLPQLTTTGGRCVYLSTPPESPAHPFVQRWHAALAAGRAAHDTVHSNPRLGAEGVRKLMEREATRLGLTLEELQASTYWRREYLAEIVTEETRAAVPAWTKAAADVCVREVPRPEHFDGYVSIDLGFQPDPHFALFAWLDFPSATLVVEDELELRGATISTLADAVKAREMALWGVNRWDGTVRGLQEVVGLPDWLVAQAHAQAPKQPLLRVGDDDKLVLAELASAHGLGVMPTRKDDKHLAVDALNQFVAARRIAVHPRCRRLIEQLYSTVWNKARTEWERTARDHGDGIDALVYLTRNVAWQKDPRPPKTDVWLQPQKPASLEAMTGLVRRR